ncbi:MAG: hypothetical protein SF187_13575 [Deltaproteobacteria bacterium]|nr:hypothetical protein [Deltaproteobacteria bacterium]
MDKRCSILRSLIPALAALGSLAGCEDANEIGQAKDAAVDAIVDAASAAEWPRSDAGSDALASAFDGASLGPDVALPEFSWSVEPMSVQLRRGTCRELRVVANRRPDFTGAITLGSGEGPFRVGFASSHIEAGASVGTIILATPHNAPAVTDKPLIIAATGKATHLRMTLTITVLDTAPAADGGVVETFADAGIWDNDTCSQTLQGLSMLNM